MTNVALFQSQLRRLRLADYLNETGPLVGLFGSEIIPAPLPLGSDPGADPSFVPHSGLSLDVLHVGDRVHVYHRPLDPFQALFGGAGLYPATIISVLKDCVTVSFDGMDGRFDNFQHLPQSVFRLDQHRFLSLIRAFSVPEPSAVWALRQAIVKSSPHAAFDLISHSYIVTNDKVNRLAGKGVKKSTFSKHTLTAPLQVGFEAVSDGDNDAAMEEGADGSADDADDVGEQNGSDQADQDDHKDDDQDGKGNDCIAQVASPVRGRRSSRVKASLSRPVPSSSPTPASSRSRGRMASAPDQPDCESSDACEVDHIVNVRLDPSRRIEYRVRWVGYGHRDDTWEPAENLERCELALSNFELTPAFHSFDRAQKLRAAKKMPAPAVVRNSFPNSVLASAAAALVSSSSSSSSSSSVTVASMSLLSRGAAVSSSSATPAAAASVASTSSFSAPISPPMSTRGRVSSTALPASLSSVGSVSSKSLTQSSLTSFLSSSAAPSSRPACASTASVASASSSSASTLASMTAVQLIRLDVVAEANMKQRMVDYDASIANTKLTQTPAQLLKYMLPDAVADRARHRELTQATYRQDRIRMRSASISFRNIMAAPESVDKLTTENRIFATFGVSAQRAVQLRTQVVPGLADAIHVCSGGMTDYTYAETCGNFERLNTAAFGHLSSSLCEDGVALGLREIAEFSRSVTARHGRYWSVPAGFCESFKGGANESSGVRLTKNTFLYGNGAAHLDDKLFLQFRPPGHFWLAVVDHANRTISIAEPLRSFSIDSGERLRDVEIAGINRWLHSERARFHRAPCADYEAVYIGGLPHQTDSISCGIFTMAYAYFRVCYGRWPTPKDFIGRDHRAMRLCALNWLHDPKSVRAPLTQVPVSASSPTSFSSSSSSSSSSM
jgi:hypothetical protein